MRGFGKVLAAAAAVALAFGLVACGGGHQKSDLSGSSGSVLGSASSSVSSIVDRAGYDEATNQSFTFRGVSFSLPSYYSDAKVDKEGVTLFQLLTADGEKDLAIVMAYSSQSKAASAEKFDANKQDAILSVLNGGTMFKNVVVTGVEQGDIAGLPSGVYDLSGDYSQNGSTRKFTGKGCIFLKPSLDYGALYFIQIDGAKSDYAPDFSKVIASASIDDQMVDGGDAVSADVKEALDSYEAFMDEYIAFMQKYKESGDASSMMVDYLSYLQKYSDAMAKIDAMDADSMSAADSAYYLEVTTRVAQKLLNAAV